MREASGLDCPTCGATKYVHNAYYVYDQDIWHIRCENCSEEWVE